MSSVCKSYSYFFSKTFQHICVSLDGNLNESLTNDIVSFEQLGPNYLSIAVVYQYSFSTTCYWYLFELPRQAFIKGNHDDVHLAYESTFQRENIVNSR